MPEKTPRLAENKKKQENDSFNREYWQNLVKRIEKIVVISFLVLAVGGGIFLGYIIHSVNTKKDLDKIASFQPTLPTRIYDSKGRLISELFQHKRRLVRLESIPKPVVKAFLAVEDTNFYNHFGIDFFGILRAAWANLKAFKVVQGGSTLTQQLAKGIYTKSEKTFGRKIYEAILALQIEKEFSKEQILELYFNQIYLGHGAYGVAEAARFYFDKSVDQLNLIEGAILAALPKAPHTYSPFRSPHRSRKKNKMIMTRLVELGYLSKADAKTTYDKFWKKYWKKIVVTPPGKTSFGIKRDKAPYFTEYVRQELVGLFGEEIVYSKGLQVYTTLDLDLQEIGRKVLLKTLKKHDPIARASNKAFSSGIDGRLMGIYSAMRNLVSLPGMVKKYSHRNVYRKKFKAEMADAAELLSLITPVEPVNKVTEEFLQSTREFRDELHIQGAYLAIDPHNGSILAMIGGREFKASDQFNRALDARRQPGSAFKPFVYGAALEDRAVHYSMGFIDSPIMNIQSDGSMWSPGNYGGGFKGNVFLNRALASSINIVSVQVYDKIGPEKIIEFTKKITRAPAKYFQPNPSLALGASELTPRELLLGVSILTNGGHDVILHPIRYVTDRDGNVIRNVNARIAETLNYKRKSGTYQLVEPGVSYIMRRMLEGVVRSGTAYRVWRHGKYRGLAAGKTGTTSSWNDAWFVGTTPDIAGVMWMGMDNGSMTLGRGTSGGNNMAPAWGEIMSTYYKKRGYDPPTKWVNHEQPEDVRGGGVCKYTGKWPNQKCDKELVGTLIPKPKKVGRLVKRVLDQTCDCEHVKTKSFLDIVQKQHNIEDNELTSRKKKRFKLYDGQ